jgi:ribosome biogenesis protein ERB1
MNSLKRRKIPIIGNGLPSILEIGVTYFRRRVFDHQTGQNTVLTDEQIEKLNAIVECKYPEIGYNPYESFLDIFSSQKEIHPISNEPEHKRSFMPSVDEKRMVDRLVRAIKQGRIKNKQDAVFEPKVVIHIFSFYSFF